MILTETINPAFKFIIPDDPTHDRIAARLADVWRDRRGPNAERTDYYLGHNKYRDLGIGVPPTIASRMRAIIGWPAKAVDTLADLVTLQAVTSGDPDSQAWLDALANRSALYSRAPQIAVSAMTHGCAFLTLGFDNDGRPVITPRSASWSTAVWDKGTGRLAAAATIDRADTQGNPTAWTLYAPDMTITMSRPARGDWTKNAYPNPLGRPLAFAVPYNPTLDRPLGRSRITRQLMGLTDAAWRTVARMETTAEYYSAPHVWLVGTAEDYDPGQNRWSSLQNAINSISVDDDGNSPTLTQLAQANMTPHADMLKSLALLVSADTDIPPEALGIDRSNPTSADALAAMERRLSRKADSFEQAFGRALEEACAAAATLTGFDLKDAHPLWGATQETSLAARTDAFQKIASSAPGYASTRTAWQRLGFTQNETDEIIRAVKAARAASLIDAALAADQTQEQQ